MGKPNTPPRLMRGATAGTAGASGYAPPPAAGDQDKPLHGDGTWRAVTNASAATDAQASEATSTTTFLTPNNALFAAAPLFNLRPPRPGVYFDGTASTRVYSAIQNIATDAFSLVLHVQLPATPETKTLAILSSNATTPGSVANSFTVDTTAGGNLRAFVNDVATGNFRLATFTGLATTYAGRGVMLKFVRNGASMTAYVNGVNTAYTETTAGTAPAWSVSITSTYLSLGYGSSSDVCTASFFGATLYNLALSQTDAEEIYFNGGRVPFRYQWGSQVGIFSGDNSTFDAGLGNWTDYAAGLIITHDAVNQELDATFTAAGQMFYMTSFAVTRYKRYRLTLTVRNAVAGSGGTWRMFENTTGSTIIPSRPFTNENISVEWTVLPGNTAFAIQRVGGAGTDSFSFDDFNVRPVGAVAHYALDEGIGYQLHDASTNKLDAVMTTTGVHHLIAKREGYVRTPGSGISWAGSHEPKNILGAASTQRMLPNEAVISQIVLKATVASTNGASVNSTNTAARWSAVAALSTTKSLRTIANSGLPAGTADADTDILIDPDTVNYTGTIQADVRYTLAEG